MKGLFAVSEEQIANLLQSTPLWINKIQKLLVTLINDLYINSTYTCTFSVLVCMFMKMSIYLQYFWLNAIDDSWKLKRNPVRIYFKKKKKSEKKRIN